jgi:pimeloyl-ACP methyl ester carboxylesterase
MPNVTANGIQIEYDTIGNPSNPSILMINGLGGQLIGSPGFVFCQEFCELLAEKGLHVIRFDNRDVGLSTKMEDAEVLDPVEVITAIMQGQEIQAPYSLEDMADDAVGLLNALDIEKAHICGASMGSAITQVVGYRHSSKTLSLIPMMGTTGNPELPQGTPEAWQLLLTPAPEERAENIEHFVKLYRVAWGCFSYYEAGARERAALAYDRCFYPQGTIRQLVATISNGNRKPRLASVTASTLVIHGSEDPLIPVEAGKDTAEAISGAELLIIEGMGHCLPRDVWQQIVTAIAKHTSKVAG